MNSGTICQQNHPQVSTAHYKPGVFIEVKLRLKSLLLTQPVHPSETTYSVQAHQGPVPGSTILPVRISYNKTSKHPFFHVLVPK